MTPYTNTKPNLSKPFHKQDGINPLHAAVKCSLLSEPTTILSNWVYTSTLNTDYRPSRLPLRTSNALLPSAHSCQNFLSSAASPRQVFWYAWHHSWNGAHMMNTVTTTGLCHGVLSRQFGNCGKICERIVMVNYSWWWVQHTGVGECFRWRDRGEDLQNQRIGTFDIRDAATARRDANCVRCTDRRVAMVLVGNRCLCPDVTTQAILEHLSYVTGVTTFWLWQVVPVIKPTHYWCNLPSYPCTRNYTRHSFNS
jgi:hypothetical protein